MGRIYTFQTYVRILLTAGLDITGALTTLIYYKKPSGTIDSVTATVSNPVTGTIFYDVETDSSGNADFLDETGTWKFWTWVEFADGRTARGETVTKEIYDHEDVC
jgi:hypothetical protein